MANVLDLVTWLLHWRYVALAIVILLGNVGLPVPEEMVLTLAGYLVREGHLALGSTLAVGIASVVVGDNQGYWLGRLGGQPIVRRGARWAGVTPARLERIKGGRVALRGPRGRGRPLRGRFPDARGSARAPPGCGR
jgi:membrane protein DedA with SNARE-associated domain